jgi:hypothetical protein
VENLMGAVKGVDPWDFLPCLCCRLALFSSAVPYCMYVGVRADLRHCWAQCINTFEEFIPKHSPVPTTQIEHCNTLHTKCVSF